MIDEKELITWLKNQVFIRWEYKDDNELEIQEEDAVNKSNLLQKIEELRKKCQ
jgi:hypothetical protein